MKELVEIRRGKQSLIEEERRVELLERENAAKLEAETADERAEQERARLVLEAAEARANAEVAEAPSTITARITEEEQVIASRAEGRAIAAKDRALREDDAPNSGLTLLTKAFKEWQARGRYDVRRTTFGDWLEGVDISQLLRT